MPKPARDIASGLENKGFRKRENDHTYFHLYVGGKKTAVFTKMSHGEREIGDRLLGIMARQLSVSRKQFLELVDCPLSSEDYEGLLRKAGRID